MCSQNHKRHHDVYHILLADCVFYHFYEREHCPFDKRAQPLVDRVLVLSWEIRHWHCGSLLFRTKYKLARHLTRGKSNFFVFYRASTVHTCISPSVPLHLVRSLDVSGRLLKPWKPKVHGEPSLRLRR